MAQYREGLITITSAAPQTVIGTGTKFMANVEVGGMLIIDHEPVPYTVAAKIDDEHLTISTPYTGPDVEDVEFSITHDVTPILGLPYPNQGDIDTHALFKASMLKVEEQIFSPSAALEMVDGSEVLPALHFGSEPATGIYRPTGGSAFGISVLGEKELIARTDGVHFNKTIFAESTGTNLRLKADGTATKDGQLVVNAAGHIAFGHWAANELAISPAGNILINTNTDDGTHRFQVTGQTKMSGGLTVTSSIVTESQFRSTSNVAYGSVLSATAVQLWSNSVYGAGLSGYGSSYDVSLFNRAGNYALRVPANTQNVEVGGALFFALATNTGFSTNGTVFNIGGLGVSSASNIDIYSANSLVARFSAASLNVYGFISLSTSVGATQQVSSGDRQHLVVSAGNTSVYGTQPGHLYILSGQPGLAGLDITPSNVYIDSSNASGVTGYGTVNIQTRWGGATTIGGILSCLGGYETKLTPTGLAGHLTIRSGAGYSTRGHIGTDGSNFLALIDSAAAPRLSVVNGQGISVNGNLSVSETLTAAIVSSSGQTTSTMNNGVATGVSQVGSGAWLVSAFIATGGSSAYTAWAVFVSTGAGNLRRMTGVDSTNLTLTAVGDYICVTQSSGVANNVTWSILRMG